GVHATLSFSRAAHRTVVPWSAVYVVACDDGRGGLYSEDVPPDVTGIAARATSDAAPPDLDADLGETAEEKAMETAPPKGRPPASTCLSPHAAAAAPNCAWSSNLISPRPRSGTG